MSTRALVESAPAPLTVVDSACTANGVIRVAASTRELSLVETFSIF
jgi:hypothetical protein